MSINRSIYAVHISESDPAKQHILIAFIGLFEIEAMEETDDSLILYHPSRDFLASIIADLVERKLTDLNSIHFEKMEDINWNKSWESSFQPVLIGEFCQIRASFHPENPAVQFDIVINPELAFGTGHHETTSSMIEHMKGLDFTGTKVLDFGCGTAILSILAEKLGAQSILAIDNDPQSLECAADCLKLNASERIELSATPIEEINSLHFDVILANINRNVLIDRVKDVCRLLKPGGLVLLSGILVHDEERIIKTYADQGLESHSRTEKNGWVCLGFSRPQEDHPRSIS